MFTIITSPFCLTILLKNHLKNVVTLIVEGLSLKNLLDVCDLGSCSLIHHTISIGDWIVNYLH